MTDMTLFIKQTVHTSIERYRSESNSVVSAQWFSYFYPNLWTSIYFRWFGFGSNHLLFISKVRLNATIKYFKLSIQK